MIDRLPKLAQQAGLPPDVIEHIQRLMQGLAPAGVEVVGPLAPKGEGGWLPRGLEQTGRLPIGSDPAAYAALTGKQERIAYVAQSREKAEIVLAYLRALSSAQVISLGVEPGRVPTHLADLYVALKTGDLTKFATTPAAIPTQPKFSGPAESWRNLDRIFAGERRIPKAGTQLDKGLTELLNRYDVLYKGKPHPTLDELMRFYFNTPIPISHGKP